MPADKERLNSLIPAGEALDIVLSDVEPCGIEEVGLHEAANRRLAKDIPSLRTQPPFDASAMDGFAVRQADVIELPTDLTIIGESRAGVPYEGSLGEGQAVRIFAGAVVPERADTIIIQENTEFSGNSVQVLTGTPEGKFIRKAGLDFKEGEVILGSDDVLSPNRLALVASMNYAKVPVRKNATVATISTGDELVLPGEA
ncbi:MAG: molybdopterin molybdenumtransferase MoeA, partial [Pseudomonadota bacterium]